MPPFSVWQSILQDYTLNNNEIDNNIGNEVDISNVTCNNISDNIYIDTSSCINTSILNSTDRKIAIISFI